jgi:lysophospholipase L1-like esterase
MESRLRSHVRFRRSASALMLALLIPLLATACGNANSATRIMPLGDSITDGYNIPGGYRIDLWRAVEDSGIDVDFVGSLRNGPPSLADRDHEGHSGWRIDQIQASVDGWIRTHQPDVVLLLIGTNDILQHYRVPTAPGRLGLLIDRIYTLRPATKIVVSTIPPTVNVTANAHIASYNAAVREVVRTRAAAGRPVWFVDGCGKFTAADLADGVHPDAAGHRKLAHAWHATLVSVLASTRPDPEG